jgi:hypothetical protein
MADLACSLAAECCGWDRDRLAAAWPHPVFLVTVRLSTQLHYKVMRRAANLIISLVLICAGLYVLYEELFVSYSGIHGRYQPFAVGLALLGSGVGWLWFYGVGDIILQRLLSSRNSAEE